MTACDYCHAPWTVPLVWRGRCYQMEEGPFRCVQPHSCPPVAAPPANERWFREETVQGKCDMCHAETIVAAALGYYDQDGQHIPFEGGQRWVCGQCHHGGTKEPTETAPRVQEMPLEILAIEAGS